MPNVTFTLHIITVTSYSVKLGTHFSLFFSSIFACVITDKRYRGTGNANDHVIFSVKL